MCKFIQPHWALKYISHNARPAPYCEAIKRACPNGELCCVKSLYWAAVQAPAPAGGDDIKLSTMPTVDWVLLEFGDSNRGRDFGSLTAACLPMHLASRQVIRVMILITTVQVPAKIQSAMA